MEKKAGVVYTDELVKLIDFIKSDAPESERVIKVFKSGDEKQIRSMLTNFGNPHHPEWKEFGYVPSWSEEQINALINDWQRILPDFNKLFWVWHQGPPMIPEERKF